MGKRYVCDYCNKAMVATPASVRTHNKGLIHQKIVREHYQQFKDPETILEEESKKKRCVKNVSGECPFGLLCRYTHFNGAQMRALRELGTFETSSLSVLNNDANCTFQSVDLYGEECARNSMVVHIVASRNRPKDIIFPSFEELVHKLLNEKTNKNHDSRDGNTVMYDSNGVTHVFPWTYNSILESYGENLPPSVKRLKIEDITDAKIETWG